MRKTYLCFTVFILCANLFSATNTIIKETKGQGNSRELAIKNALIEAVAQSNGVEISSADSNFDLTYNDKSSFEFEVISVHAAGTADKIKVSGFIKTYEILEEKKIDAGTYEVLLKAWIYDYQPSEKNNRYNLTVVPMQTSEQKYYFDNTIIPADELSERIRHKISTSFTNTNKFAVLSGDYFDADFAKSRHISDPNDLDIKEKSKTGKSLSSDYMLTGFLSDAKLKIKEKYLKAINRTVKECELDFVFDYKIIVASTKQIKLANTINYHLETGEVKKLTSKRNLDDINISELIDNLLEKLSNQVVSEVVERIYPTRIAVVLADDQVIINQGSDRLKNGMIMDVIINDSDQIIDFDTKESLGCIETTVAKIKISQVKPNFSYANVLEGQNKIAKDLVCRIYMGDK